MRNIPYSTRSFFVGLIFSLSIISLFSSPPNVVVFLVDDLGYMDVGANNPGMFYETPNIDRLAKEGMRFTDGYAACQVCSPTRAAIMTGKFPVRTGITDYINAPQPDQWKRNTLLLPAPYAEQLAHEETTLAEIFKANGYATFFAGKWHLGKEPWWPEHQGFDINKGGIDRGGPYGGGKYFSPYGNPRLEDGPDGEYLPLRLARETVSFIENQHGPFLAYLSFYSVHTPLMTAEYLEQKYTAKRNLNAPEDEFGTEGERKVRLNQNHAVYAGMIEAMDTAVGLVLASLDKLSLVENTIVIFTSDNGGLSTSEGSPTSNVPLRGGKGWIYEGGIRVPWIVRYPGWAKAGTTNGTIIISNDILPTLVDLTDMNIPQNTQFDGISFAKALEGNNLDRPPVFWHYPHYGNQGGFPSGAIRSGKWKLIENYETGELSLYNLEEDIGEKNNLAIKEPGRVRKLHDLLIRWRQETGARMPTKNPQYAGN